MLLLFQVDVRYELSSAVIIPIVDICPSCTLALLYSGTGTLLQGGAPGGIGTKGKTSVDDLPPQPRQDVSQVLVFFCVGLRVP